MKKTATLITVALPAIVLTFHLADGWVGFVLGCIWFVCALYALCGSTRNVRARA